MPSFYLQLKLLLIYLICFHDLLSQAALVDPCPDCVGKMHRKEDLQLVKQPLIIDKARICRSQNVPLVIIVKSGDFQRRNFTRSTWAKEIRGHFDVPILYAIGYPKNLSLQEEILLEDRQYQDLLQFNILESYFNLTIKSSSVLYWFDRHCANSSRYLLYVDDDVLIHVDRLIMYIYRLNTTDTIEGWFENSGRIQRRGIGGVSKQDFPIDIAPDYLWGAAVLYPSTIISSKLLPTIFNTNLSIFFRDDVFINGFIAEETSVKRRSMPGVVLYDSSEDDLQHEMIVIDFKSEENRRRAWLCFREKISCNKNIVLLIFKIIFLITSIAICILYTLKSLMRTRWCQNIFWDVYGWFNEIRQLLSVPLFSHHHVPRQTLMNVRTAKSRFH